MADARWTSIRFRMVLRQSEKGAGSLPPLSDQLEAVLEPPMGLADMLGSLPVWAERTVAGQLVAKHS
jgi:hypothetical protein